jgi:tetratricopeptide (TPR) repeat protein
MLLPALIKLLSLNPGDPEIYIEKATAEESIGMFENAKESLETAIDLDPMNEDAYFDLGIFVPETGKISGCYCLFQKDYGIG